jgi:GNAT superfamily N-acetyltransferase
MASYRFRPALPHDRRQIRLLLRCFDQAELRFGPVEAPGSPRKPSWYGLSSRHLKWLAARQFGLGLLLGLVLHGLWSWGGLPLLSLGLLGSSMVAWACWLNLYLFADWQNYWVIEQGSSLIACGKLTYGRTHVILADVVVSPSWRRQGVGAFLVKSIVDQVLDQSAVNPAGNFTTHRADQIYGQVLPVYLACLPRLVPFYQRFGFQPVELSHLSFGLRQELGLRMQPALRAMVLVD